MKLSFTKVSLTNILILFNCLFIIFSMIVLTFGVIPQIYLLKFANILHGVRPSIFPIVCFTGSFVIIVACVGIIGLMKGGKCLLTMHIIALIIATIIDISTATLSAIKQNEFLTKAGQVLNDSSKLYYKNRLYATEFDLMHITFKCCNVKNDYSLLGTLHLIPESCTHGIEFYKQQCNEPLNKYVRYYIDILIYLCFIFGFIKLIYSLFTFTQRQRIFSEKTPVA
ncbi:25 kDa integral membrane protein [Schistosoma japonicum]|uniref:25 kDa integral membrane protein n=1 Tax=Schistosoma japonicum TaxID=6182 RepID=IM25_SCHJA|nr:RecName: Full=25 kDa integral membrane protein; AltName: Full=Sj25; AltName: Full=Sj25/TM4 [Schistosoma japonicum]AAB88626.1 Sj25 [Schistosoma japonicum]KAH8849311.1 25 kDa integral membrane protein [Schistosoma japonicum]